jgi:hypothetical protein
LSSRRCEPSPGCRRGRGEPGHGADVFSPAADREPTVRM